MRGRQINWVISQISGISQDMFDLIGSERHAAHEASESVEAFDARMREVSKLPEQARGMIKTLRALFPNEASGKDLDKAESILEDAIKAAIPFDQKRAPEEELLPGTVVCGICQATVVEKGLMVVAAAPNGNQPVRNRVDISRYMMMAVKQADPHAQKVERNSFESENNRIMVVSLKKSKGSWSFRVNLKALSWTLADMSKNGSVIFICGRRGAVEVESGEVRRIMQERIYTNARGITYGNVSIAEIDDENVKIYNNRQEIIEGPSVKHGFLLDFEEVDEIEDAELLPA
jgi:hypothetical protein